MYGDVRHTLARRMRKSLPGVTNVGDAGVTCRATLGTECALD